MTKVQRWRTDKWLSEFRKGEGVCNYKEAT